MDERKKETAKYSGGTVMLSAVAAALLTVVMMNSFKTDVNRDELLTRLGNNKRIRFFFVDPEYVVFEDQVSTVPSGLDVAYSPFILNRLNFPETHGIIADAIFPVTSEDRSRELVFSENRIIETTDRARLIVVPMKDPDYLQEKEKDIAGCLKLMDRVQIEKSE